MKLVPVLTLLLLAACSPAGANNKVVGTYALDTKALVAEMQKQKGKADATVDDKKLAELFQTTLEISADGTAEMKGTMMGQPQDHKGTWKLEGDKITITQDAGKDQPFTGKVENGTITLSAPGGQGSMVFRKK